MPTFERPSSVQRLELAACCGVYMALASACTDFATPAELSKPTVIAVIATPPITKPGASSALEVVMVGPSGVLVPSQTTWTLTPTYAGYDTIGTITPGGPGQATYTAPTTLPALPANALPVDTLQISVSGGGTTVDVVKLVGIASVDAANPTVEFLANGAPAPEGLEVTPGEKTTLELIEAPDPSDDARWAWYSTFGLIENYQSNPAELEIAADEEASSGWLFGVYRDGVGGVAWQAIPLTMAP